MDSAFRIKDPVVLEPGAFERLFGLLQAGGYRVIGPTVQGGAIVYDHLASPQQLPAGWTHEQGAGSYRLRKRTDQALFGYTVGPHSWKKFLYPATQRLFSAKRNGDGFHVMPEENPALQYALVGVRACDLRALGLLDQVFVKGPWCDPVYQARRAKTFIVAVNCSQAGGTCFCASLKTGPAVDSGYDLVLTELCESGRHCFLARAGTDQGAQMLAEIPHQPAQAPDLAAAQQAVARAA